MKTQLAIQKFLHNRRAQNLKPKTIQWYEEWLGKFARCYSELPASPEPIEDFLNNVRGVPETKHAYYRALKAFYRFLKKRHGFDNPIEQIGPTRCPSKIMPTLEPVEIMQLLNLAVNPRDRALLTLFVDTGARVDELAGLRRKDIKNDSILVNGKTGEREIPISDETRRLLQALITSNKKTDYVFIGPRRRPLTRSGIYILIRKLMERADIQGPKLGPHRLRHTFGKCYLVNGGDTRSLQLIMGHANITTTEKYASLNLTDIVAKHHKFTPLQAAHAAAQESFFDTSAALREVEEILTKKEAEEVPSNKKASYDTVSVGKTPPLPGLSEL